MRDHADEHDENAENDNDADDGDEGADTGEGGAGDVDTSAETQLPRARARKAVDVVPVSPFGGVPRDANAWGIRKKTEVSTWTKDLEWSAPGATIALKEWPLEQLSEEEVRRRWGPGTYAVHWLKSGSNGARGHIAYGREVTILPAVAPSPASSPAAPSTSAAGLNDALQMMQLLDQAAAERRASITAEANQTINGMAQLAAVMQRNAGGGGLDAATLATILRENREATVAAVREAVGTEEEEEEGVAAVANVAAPFFKGKGALSAVLNFAQSNPQVAQKAIETGLPLAVGLLQKLAEVLIPPKPAPPPPAPVVQQLPRAVPAPSPPAAPPPKPVPRTLSGLSAGAGLESVQPLRGAAPEGPAPAMGGEPPAS